MKSENLHLKKTTRQRGISLIEAILFLSIACTVMVGAIVFFEKAQEAQQAKLADDAKVVASSSEAAPVETPSPKVVPAEESKPVSTGEEDPFNRTVKDMPQEGYDPFN